MHVLRMNVFLKPSAKLSLTCASLTAHTDNTPQHSTKHHARAAHDCFYKIHRPIFHSHLPPSLPTQTTHHNTLPYIAHVLRMSAFFISDGRKFHSFLPPSLPTQTTHHNTLPYIAHVLRMSAKIVNDARSGRTKGRDEGGKSKIKGLAVSFFGCRGRRGKRKNERFKSCPEGGGRGEGWGMWNVRGIA